MKTAKEILYETATKYNDGFLSGQVRWIVEAMEEYAEQVETYANVLLCQEVNMWKEEFEKLSREQEVQRE